MSAEDYMAAYPTAQAMVDAGIEKSLTAALSSGACQRIIQAESQRRLEVQYAAYLMGLQAAQGFKK